MRALTVALILLVAAPALAQTETVSRPAELRVPLTLSIDTERQWHLDDSYRLFGTRRSELGGGLSAALEVKRFGRGRLDLGAGVQWSGDSATWEQDNDAHRELMTPSVGATLRWAAHRWFEPHLRVAGDLTRAMLRVQMADGAGYEDKHWVPGASAGAGFRLRTKAIATALGGGKFGFAGAFIVEGGFHVGPPLSFELHRQAPADEKLAADQIPAASISVGGLGRTEPYLRISFALLL